MHGAEAPSLAALVYAEPADFGRSIWGGVRGRGVDLSHGDAASQVRDVGVIDSNNERGSRGGCFFGCSARDQIPRKVVFHVVHQAGYETAKTDSVQHAHHRLQHSDPHRRGAYNEFGTPKAGQ